MFTIFTGRNRNIGNGRTLKIKIKDKMTIVDERRTEILFYESNIFFITFKSSLKIINLNLYHKK